MCCRKFGYIRGYILWWVHKCVLLSVSGFISFFYKLNYYHYCYYYHHHCHHHYYQQQQQQLDILILTNIITIYYQYYHHSFLSPSIQFLCIHFVIYSIIFSLASSITFTLTGIPGVLLLIFFIYNYTNTYVQIYERRVAWNRTIITVTCGALTCPMCALCPRPWNNPTKLQNISE